MKKHILLLLFLSLLLPGMAQIQTKQNPFFEKKSQHSFVPDDAALWTCDSVWNWYWNTTLSSWLKIGREIISYNNKKKITSRILINWDYQNSEWKNTLKTEYEYFQNDSLSIQRTFVWSSALQSWNESSHLYYDEEKRLTEIQEYFYDNQGTLTGGDLTIVTYNPPQVVNLDKSLDVLTMSWTNENRYTRTYNSSGNLVSSISETWVEQTSVWVNQEKAEITYNNEGNKTDETYSLWNNGTQSWIFQLKFTYSYNTAGWNTLQTLSYWNDLTSTWDPGFRETRNYDEYGRNIQNLVEKWNNNASIWENSQKELFSYYPNDKQNEYFRYWWLPATSEFKEIDYEKKDSTGNTLEEYSLSINMTTFEYYEGYRSNFTYSNGLLDHILGEEWNTDSVDWVNSSQNMYTYDQNRNLTESQYQYYSNNEWVPNGKKEYFYSSTDGITEPEKLKDYCVFSNPLKKGEKISCSGINEGSSLRLLNLAGQIVYSSKVSSGKEIVFPRSLASGIYLLEIKEQNHTISGKIILTQ